MTTDAGALLWKEAMAARELASLLLEPVFYGSGVPRGDGRLVAVLPGLFANDAYLHPMHGWLERIGYTPVPSSMLVNAGCPDRLAATAEAALRRRMPRRPGPVALIGHSRGGILARAMAARLGADSSHLVLLGSPVGAFANYFEHGLAAAGRGAARRLGAWSSRVREIVDPQCSFPSCGCDFVRAMRQPLATSTRVTVICSADDPIVAADWCRLKGAATVEVRGTHSGLAYNADVYRAVGKALAEGPRREARGSRR